MNKLSADTRCVIIERDMPHPPEKIWRDFQAIVGHRFNFHATPSRTGTV